MATSTSTSASHKKTYLCAPPHRDDWDELTEAVLRGLGPRANTEISTTLDRIVNVHKWQRKKGPGRKSAAEHAIHFYEHLLEQVPHEDSSDSDNTDDDNSTETGDDKKESTETGGDESDDEEGDKDVSRVDEKRKVGTPLKSSDPTQCEVCEEGEEKTMACTNCNLAFHLDCVRPAMTGFPKEPNWRCAYCVLATEPKNTKKRRESAAAVRLMARLRNGSRRRKALQQYEEEGGVPTLNQDETTEQQSHSEAKPPESSTKTESPVDSDEKPPEATTEGSQSSTPTDAATADADETEQERKKNVALFKLADAFTGKVPNPGEEAGRGKRTRKQPTLFDPQTVAARSWQSDEAFLSRSEDESDDSENTNSQDESPARTGREMPDGDVFCGFCQDDSLIELCVFCGCRKCFGKHQKTKLLLCDSCNEEYHTFCLQPPMTTVPLQKWFCFSCTVSKKAVAGVNTVRKSSRAPPEAPPEPPPEAPRKSRRARPTKKRDSQENRVIRDTKPRERKRSRASKSSASPPKKRGRPSKNALPVINDLPIPVRSSNGRFVSPTGDSPRAGRFSDSSARSQSSAKAQDRMDFKEVEPQSTRSGRTVKRTSFHDEIDEGEQHLRSERMWTDGRSSNSGDSEREETPTRLRRQEAFSESSRPRSAVEGAAMEKFEVRKLPVPVADRKMSPAAANPASHKPPVSSGSLTGKASARVGTTPAASLATSSFRPAASAGAMSQPLQSGLGMRLAVAQASRPAVAASATALSVAGMSESGADADMDNREAKVPRRKPGARECMQISRRFGVRVIPEKYSEILFDYCKRGKVEHLIRMRERLDEHSRFLELQLAGLESLVKEKGESHVVVPVLPEGPDRKLEKTIAGDAFDG